MTSHASRASDDGGADTLWRRVVILVAATFAAGLYVGTQTIANAVLPQMQGDFSAGIDQIAWVVTVSVVGGAVSIPPTAWLADRFGRRRLFVFCLLGFSVGTLMAGFADSLSELIVARALTAVCGAPSVALSQAVALDTFPERERGAAFSFWSIGILAGWIFAPALGAYLAELQSWRLIFFALTPLGLIAAAGCAVIPGNAKKTAGGFDGFGFATLSLALGAFLIVLNRGQRLDWLESTEIVLWLVTGVIATYMFVVHSYFSDRVLIRWSVLRDRNFAVGLALILGYAHMNLAPLVLIPTMLEELKGLEMLTTGLVLIPRGLAQIFGLMFVWALANRCDPRILIVAGLVCFAAASWIMSGYNLNIGLWDVVWPNIVQGLAMSLIWIPAINLTYANLAPSLRTDAASLVSLVYSTSASAGVAVGVALLTHTAQISHEELASQVLPTNELLRFREYAQVWDLSSLQSLAAIDAEIGRQALMIGYVNVYLATAGFALALIPLGVSLKNAMRPAT